MGAVLGVLQVVSNLDSMVSFFVNVLEFEEVKRWDLFAGTCEKLFQLPNTKAKFAKLRLGSQYHYLIEFSSGQGSTYPENARSNDLEFQHVALVVSNMQQAYDKLMIQGVRSISTSPQTIPQWNKAAAGIEAFYFRSPDGHPLELIYFPPGKGNPIWQNSDSLFLGIDHTAITISKTDESLKFYRDLLGMHVVGESLNFGDTQEKLSKVPGAKVKITSLQFADSQGMGIEFLEYESPLNGRKKSQNSAAGQLSEIETIIAVDDLSSILKKMRRSNIAFLSQSLTEIEEFEKIMMVFDPDGHRILMTENTYR